MRILLVTATAAEAAPVRSAPGRHDIEVLTTGVGMVATAAACASRLARSRYDLALNIGVCGSFDSALAPCAVVHVVSDSLPELGAEDGDAFLSIHDLGLLGPDDPPFTGGRLVNPAPPRAPTLAQLPAVHGITVNTVHGRESTIADVVQRARPQVETMEGAAFMYACLVAGVPFAQVRAVSNRVERRNRAAWRMAEAVRALGDTVARVIDDL